jgi:predicted TPR repeat methyltransferase
MPEKINAALHDTYAADYDNQMQAYDCHIPDVLFGMCYEYMQPGQSILDLGIGSGLSALLFAKAGLKVFGMDFSAAMLGICRSKGIAAELKQHDLQQIPWPYPSNKFEHINCCGVLHFISELEVVFSETKRVLRQGGLFAFTTRAPISLEFPEQKYNKQTVGGFEIFSHSSKYLKSLQDQHSFAQLKTQKCLVGEDVFTLRVVRKKANRN